MRLIFMGTPAFSVAALEALHQAGHEICAVYTRPSARSGRGMEEQFSPVHACAEALGLPVFTPQNLKSAETQEQFAAHQADLAVVVAYGLLLPQLMLDVPRLGCWNIHASLLPRWRGAAPIHRAVMAHDAETGVCIMQMEAGLDTGPVLLQKKLPILTDDTTASLHDKLMVLGGEAIVKAIIGVMADPKSLTPAPQAEEGVTYAAKIDKAETRLDWTRPASKLDAHIRGLAPFPGAWCEAHGKRLKILQARSVDGSNVGRSGLAGTVLSVTPLTIACGQGALELMRVQKAGKPAMDADAYLRGASVSVGDVLA